MCVTSLYFLFASVLVGYTDVPWTAQSENVTASVDTLTHVPPTHLSPEHGGHMSGTSSRAHVTVEASTQQDSVQHGTPADPEQPFGDEARLLQVLLKGYVKAARPVANASHIIVVKVNFALTQILDIDEKNQILTTNVWFTQEWRDEKMVWNPDHYNGLATLRIPPELIWRPDIVLYNGVDDYGDKVYSQCLAMVKTDGMVFWAPIANLRSTCVLDLTFFPFDDQVCHFKIGSWTYDGFQLDLLNTSEGLDLGQYIANGGWNIIATRTSRNIVYYNCCPEPFPDVTFTIYLRRRTLYYIVNVVVPCLLLAGLSMLGFWLPVGTSEKVTLGLTVLLAFYVLELSIADRIPETSEFVPLIGLYLMVIMILTAVSIAMCVFILHIHSLGERSYRVPKWLHKVTTKYLARIVGLTHIVKHRQNNARASYMDDVTHPLESDCENANSRCRLIQIEGYGLYLLTKDTEETIIGDSEENKNEINHSHEKLENRRVLRAVLLDQRIERDKAGSNELMWHDIAEIVDRFFFWLCFLINTMSTMCILVILPLSKPDPLQNMNA